MRLSSAQFCLVLRLQTNLYAWLICRWLQQINFQIGNYTVTFEFISIICNLTWYNFRLPWSIDYFRNKNSKATSIMRPNCALDRRTILCLFIPGFQRQVFKHGKILSERSKRLKKQKKNKRSVLFVESVFNTQKHSLASYWDNWVAVHVAEKIPTQFFLKSLTFFFNLCRFHSSSEKGPEWNTRFWACVKVQVNKAFSTANLKNILGRR